jgi:hypothetical protein
VQKRLVSQWPVTGLPEKRFPKGNPTIDSRLSINGSNFFLADGWSCELDPKRFPDTRPANQTCNPETKQKTPFFRDFPIFPGLGRPKTGDPSHQGSIFWDLQGLQRGFVDPPLAQTYNRTVLAALSLPAVG